ncbi:MarR family winged helix-turn-helix transcriptional regulator [Nocardia nova]|uniref:MarR family winged helix-turn-helix transcriptional regulator n=1 Tax=Nocardia nova TaxID=37330 RepID=UPI00371F6A2A
MDNDSALWLTAEELRTFRAFNRSWRALDARLDRDLQRAMNMPRTYFEILWRLRRAPERALRMSELAEATDSKASRITHAVGKLEQAGLIRREVAAEDRRGWVAILTDEGLRVVEQAAPRYADGIRENFLDRLTPAMRKELTRIGELLIASLEPEDASAASEKQEDSAAADLP